MVGAASVTAREIRSAILTHSRRAAAGNVGSALSVADLVAGILHALELARGDGALPDCFVLSKGHAALALYAGLQRLGILGPEALDAYCADGSRLAVHPDHRVPGVRFSTGSLGLGLSYAAGSALAARLRGSLRRTVVLVSDAELDCGVAWEALMFAAHHRLGRLHVVVDFNGSQAMGRTRDVLDLRPLAPRFTAFGFEVDEIDGHDLEQVRGALAPPPAASVSPRATIARTRLGQGVSFMEGRLEWRYLRLTEEQYRAALREVRGE